MRNCGFIGVCALALALYETAFAAQDLGRYREFELGSEVAAVSNVTGIALSDVKVVHHRPALIQELTWRPRYGRPRPASDTESVERVVFGFYDDQLFRVTVDYDRERTKGLTDADMIEAISSVYGGQVKLTVSRNRQAQPVYEDSLGTPIAQWGTLDHSVMLYRSFSYATSFRLVVTSEPMAALARTAAARALELDAREAPQREAARERKETEDRRAADEKARSRNKPAFRP